MNCIVLSIYEIYIALLQGNYSEALMIASTASVIAVNLCSSTHWWPLVCVCLF